MTVLLIVFTLFAQPDIEDSTFDPALFFYATASADLESGMKSLSADTLLVFPQVSFINEWVSLSSVSAMTYSEDTTVTFFQPVSAGAFFKWPGSPWIGTGVSLRLLSPFIPGLNKPVLEWQPYSMNDSTVVTLEAGGLMGFKGFWNQSGDSLSWCGVNSPWLGFGSVGWNRVLQDTSSLEVYSGFLDLQVVQPWFLFVNEGSRWTYLTEVRGWKTPSMFDLSMEIVPMIYFEEDSNAYGITTYLNGKNTAISGSLQALFNSSNYSEPSFSAGLDVLSQAGINWAVKADYDQLKDLYAEISGFYLMSPAGCGASLELIDHNLRVTSTALYSPVPGVAAEFSVMADVSCDSPKPGCIFRVYGSRESFSSVVTVDWNDGSTTLGLEVSAWID